MFLDRPMGRDPQDQPHLQIRGAVAEYERTLIAERMRRGRQAKLRAGCLLPWSRAPYGYRLDPDHPRDPPGVSPLRSGSQGDPEVTVEAAEAAAVQGLFAGYVEDHASLFSLAKHPRVREVASPNGRPPSGAAFAAPVSAGPDDRPRRSWSPTTLRGILINPTYIGQVNAGR